MKTTSEIIEDKIKQAYENWDIKKLYKYEEDYLTIAQLYREKWNTEMADFYYKRSDECARLSDSIRLSINNIVWTKDKLI